MKKEFKRLKEELNKAKLAYQKATDNINNYLNSLYKEGDTLIHESSPIYIKVLGNYYGTAKVIMISSNAIEIKWIDTAILIEYTRVSEQDFKNVFNRTVKFISSNIWKQQ